MGPRPSPNGSGVLGRAVGPRLGGDAADGREEELQAIQGRSGEQFHSVLRVRHEPHHSAGLIGDAGNRVHGTVVVIGVSASSSRTVSGAAWNRPSPCFEGIRIFWPASRVLVQAVVLFSTVR